MLPFRSSNKCNINPYWAWSHINDSLPLKFSKTATEAYAGTALLGNSQEQDETL